jgi:hypothetical protein
MIGVFSVHASLRWSHQNKISHTLSNSMAFRPCVRYHVVSTWSCQRKICRTLGTSKVLRQRVWLRACAALSYHCMLFRTPRNNTASDQCERGRVSSSDAYMGRLFHIPCKRKACKPRAPRARAVESPLAARTFCHTGGSGFFVHIHLIHNSMNEWHCID